MAARDDSRGHAAAEDAAPPPPDPRQLRVLKTVVVTLAVLIVLALAALVAGIIVKSRQLVAPAAAPRDIIARLPAGATVEHMVMNGDRLAVRVRGEQGVEILMFDLRKGRLRQRLKLIPAGR